MVFCVITPDSFEELQLLDLQHRSLKVCVCCFSLFLIYLCFFFIFTYMLNKRESFRELASRSLHLYCNLFLGILAPRVLRDTSCVI